MQDEIYDEIYDEIVDYTQLKYVLYARKSTTDESRQLRSIPDQLYDCMAMADRLGIKIGETDIRTGEKSAKTPGIRPVFNQMIKDIEAGKYNAVMAWNPDRLARNMLEAGMVIDLVDNIIKDFRFVTHPCRE